MAFLAKEEEIEAWRAHFAAHDVAIDQIVEWDEGGRSLYVRDPAGNSVEFAPATLWGRNWTFGQDAGKVS